MTPRRSVAVLVQVTTLVVAAAACGLAFGHPEVYYRFVQEDELLEWCTAFAFLFAAALHVGEARAVRSARLGAWALAATGALCFLIAMEEISWGQRLLGFRPPEFFLEENYQQELNLHNLLARWLRKSAVVGLILVHGLLLPALSRWRRLAPVRAALSPRSLMPLFAFALLVQLTYPLRFTGEWVELLLGLGFLCAPLVRSCRGQDTRRRALARPLLAFAALLACALLATIWSRDARSAAPEALAAAALELDALAADARRSALEPGAHGHGRLHGLVWHRGFTNFEDGAHEALARQGLPPERGEYFLDPWNGPYWMRYRCEPDGTRRMLVYSLGPNRIRESIGYELGGDDLGRELRLPAATAGLR